MSWRLGYSTDEAWQRPRTVKAEVPFEQAAEEVV